MAISLGIYPTFSGPNPCFPMGNIRNDPASHLTFASRVMASASASSAGTAEPRLWSWARRRAIKGPWSVTWLWRSLPLWWWLTNGKSVTILMGKLMVWGSHILGTLDIGKIIGYPLVNWRVCSWKSPVSSLIYLSTMGIFHSYLNIYQRVMEFSPSENHRFWWWWWIEVSPWKLVTNWWLNNVITMKKTQRFMEVSPDKNGDFKHQLPSIMVISSAFIIQNGDSMDWFLWYIYIYYIYIYYCDIYINYYYYHYCYYYYCYYYYCCYRSFSYYYHSYYCCYCYYCYYYCYHSYYSYYY